VIGDEDSPSKAADSDTVYATPGNPRQLIRTVKEAAASQRERFIRFSNLVVDCQQRQVLHNEECYHLTPKAYSLLHLLIDNQDRDLSRKVIMKHVWETDYMGDTRTLDVHIRWLREKIEDDPSRPRRLITIRGVGYRFVADPE
jgi:DNA-binding response OmpR family regulator